jgi:predicted ATPase
MTAARLNADLPHTRPRQLLPPTRWHVRLLGGLALDDGRQQITRLPSRAVTALLARLALAPLRAHAREELIELLWPGVEVTTGRNRLRQALSTLKSVLEPPGSGPTPVLQADRLHVRVAPNALGCDAIDFECHVRVGEVALARELYRGDLLPGFYDEWIDDERRRLAALYDRLMPAPPSSPVETPRVPAVPPESALAAAHVLLPNYLTRMFGATDQGLRLRRLVLTQRLVTLIGPGGAGKSRLAVEVAHSVREHAAWPLPASEPFEPFDLIAFVPMATCSSRPQVLDQLLGTLQIAPGAQDARSALAAALAGRRALLVIDNFEQLVEAAASLLEELLSALPQLRLLVTSRRVLDLAGEYEFVLDTLSVPPADTDLAAAADNPAVALFVERARAARADFHLHAGNAATVCALVRALEGMPLAIELAAARVRSIAPTQMLERLQGTGTPRLDLLARSSARRDNDPRHSSMQRTIDWSWQLLSAPQARLLSALTVFADGFTTAAAAMLMLSHQSLEVPLLLDDLVAHSLVQARHEGDSPRFTLYQPIREFVAARQDAAEQRMWRARLREWALQFARSLPPTPPLPTLRTELPNLVAAMASAATDDAAAEAIELLLVLRRCFEDVELPAEGLAQVCGAIALCADPRRRALGHSAIAPLLFTAGRADAALWHAEQGAACADLDVAQRARALHTLARVRWRSRRDAVTVEPLIDEAQALLPAEGQIELRASLLALRAFVCNAHRREHARGELLHAQALALWEQLGNQHAINSGRYNLAVCAQNAGRNAECLQRLAPVIESARLQQDWRRLSQSLNVRGNAYSGLRDWPCAAADYQECVRVAWAGMAAYDLAFGLWNLPRTLVHLRRPDLAVPLAAWSAAFWQGRFGPLQATDQRYLVRVRRMAGLLLPPDRLQTLWRDGERLSMPQAVALALTATS